MRSWSVPAFLLCFLIGVLAHAEPPRVIRAVPDHGDTDVDPAISEIRIEFDQDMSVGAFSICGGGPTFPELLERPRWESARVLVLKVRLQPAAEYSFSVNCSSAQNTRSVAGEPAEIYPISFATRSAAAEASNPALTREQNARAVAALRAAIDTRYAYRDLRGVDWDAAFDEFEPRLLAAESPVAFARDAARLLQRAGDIHNTVWAGEHVFATHRRAVAPNARAETLAKIVPGLSRVSDAVWTGRFEDGIGYINITTWASSGPALLEPAAAALESFRDAKGLVIDVRFNSGGDELLARDFASRFVSEPAVYSKNRYRTGPGPDGFGPVLERTIEPRPGGTPYAGKVTVLMGKANMSSCESFLLMMRTSPGVRTFGEQSYGASGNPKPHDLGNGVTVFLSSWQALAPDGEVLEGTGITPDVEIPAKPEEFLDSDPVLDAALRWLRE